MEIHFANEAEAIAAYDHWCNSVDPRVSDTDLRRVVGRERNGLTVTLQVEEWTAASLKARIADIRWQRETGGVEVLPGVTFPTTRDLVDRPYNKLKRAEEIGPEYSEEFVIDSKVITVNLQQLRAVVDVIESHVKSCFAWQAALIKRIDAGEDLNTIAAEALSP